MSASIDFRHRDKIISLITLSDQESIAWLKENGPALEDYSSNHEFDQNQDWRQFVEYVWYRRDSSRLRLALAKYGCTNPTLDRLKKYNKYKKTLLSNVLAYAEQGFVKGFNNIFSKTEINQIIENWPKAKDELLIFFNNENISRDFINDLLSDKKSLFAKKNDERSSFIVALIANNPVIKKFPPEDIKYDGWASYNFGKLTDTLLEVIQEAPATSNWSVALQALIKENPFRYLRDSVDEEQFLKKWQDNPKDEKPKFGETDRYYLRMAFWKFYAQNIIHLSCPFDLKSSDKEALCTMVQFVDAREWLGTKIDGKDFDPPIFDRANMAEYDRYDEEKQNSKETNEVRETIQSLFDKGVELHDFINADHLYANKKRRQLLRRVVREYDKRITEWEIHRWREDQMRDKYPEAFEDDNELDSELDSESDEQPEELLKKKTDEIRQALRENSCMLTFISSDIDVREDLDFIGSETLHKTEFFLDLTNGTSNRDLEQLKSFVKSEHKDAFALENGRFFVYLSPPLFNEFPEIYLKIDFIQHKNDEDSDNARTIEMKQDSKTIIAGQWDASLHLRLTKEQITVLTSLCKEVDNNRRMILTIEFDPETPDISIIDNRSLTYRVESSAVMFNARIDDRMAIPDYSQREHQRSVDEILQRSQNLGENVDDLTLRVDRLSALFQSTENKNASNFKAIQIYCISLILLFILTAVYLILFN